MEKETHDEVAVTTAECDWAMEKVSSGGVPLLVGALFGAYTI